jgi:hypothetical protein
MKRYVLTFKNSDSYPPIEISNHFAMGLAASTRFWKREFY